MKWRLALVTVLILAVCLGSVGAVTPPVTDPLEPINPESGTGCVFLLLGDANGDCRVNILDFSLLAACYGCKEGRDSCYNPNCDWNCNSWNYIGDYYILAIHYGWTCWHYPPPR